MFPHDCADGWVCEDHPYRATGHDGCPAAGMPCPFCNGDGARKPAFDLLVASTSAPPSVLARYDVLSGPREIGDMWTLAKGSLALRCVLITHPMSWELRLKTGAQFIRSHVCKLQSDVFDIAETWKHEAVGKGWTDDA